MSTKIQLKRGLEQDIPVLSEGEPAFTTDTWKLFIGSKNGNKQVFGGSGNVTPNTQSWVSTDGQDTFTITNGNITNAKSLIVFVGGIIQPNITLVNSTAFKLPETIGAGIDVYAIWFEVSASSTTNSNHHATHELGGTDEIDITKLKNYDLISNEIGVLSNLETSDKTSLVNAVNENTVQLAQNTSFLQSTAINVKIPFGTGLTPAKGDGATDDTSSIQAIINYAQTLVTDRFKDGVTVLIPKGTFKVSGTLTVTSSNIMIAGNSHSDSVLYADSANFDIVNFDGSSLSLYAVGMKNLRIYTPTNATAGYHVRVTKTINAIFQNLNLIGWYNGIAIDGAGQTYFDNILLTQENRSAGVSNLALDFLKTNGINSDIHFSNLQVVPSISPTSSSDYSISIKSSDGIYFDNIHVHGGLKFEPDNTGNGQTLASVFFSNAYFDVANDANIQFTGSANAYRNFKFSNCYFRQGYHGVKFNTSVMVSKVQFSNCTFGEAKNSGVYCMNANSKVVSFSNCIFTDNNSTNTAGQGDMVLQGTDYNISGITFVNGGSNGYGLYASALTYSTIDACNFVDSTAGTKFASIGTGVHIGTFSGFIVRNHGSVTLNSGTTSITASHGLGITPAINQIMLTLQTSIYGAGSCRVSSTTSTQFTITADVAPSSNVTFTWWADVTG